MMPGDSRTTLRVASPADAAPLARLRWDFRAQHAEVGEGEPQFIERCGSWMATHLVDATRWLCVIAEDASTGNIAGAAWVQYVEKLPNPTDDEPELHAYITSVYVQPSARGGTGTKLLEALLAHVDARGVDSVFLWPTERSRSLYLRSGFRGAGSLGVMERRLTESV